ncbi:hypothetical protein [Sulfurimonas sp.]
MCEECESELHDKSNRRFKHHKKSSLRQKKYLDG